MAATTSRRVLLLDNHDSFTFNLVQALATLGAEVEVRQSDETTVEACLSSGALQLILSPGPGRPEDAGISVALVRAAAGRLPILGVCLGFQAIVVAFGGRVDRMAQLVHGESSPAHHDGRTIFHGIPDPFDAGRYHSLGVPADGVPADFVISARTDRGEVMGIRHRLLPIEGVQFHPESILTPHGPAIIRNFLALG